jgi:hypothetical protein
VNAWKPILAAVIIFAAGIAIGHLATPPMAPPESATPSTAQRFSRPGGPDRRGGPGRNPWSPVLSEEQIGGICSRMTEDLTLSLTQSNEIASILLGSQSRMKAIADEYLPRTKEEFLRTREAIQSVLTPEQKTRFEEGFKRHQSRFGRREGGDRQANDEPRPEPSGNQPPPPPTPEQ